MERLTKREQGFVKDYAKGESGGQAVENHFNMKGNSAYAYSSKLKKKPKVKKKLMSIADQIPDKLLVEKHLALLNKKEVLLKNNITTGEVDVKQTGEIDSQAVSKGLDMAYKIKSTYAPDKVKHSGVIAFGELGSLDNDELKRIAGISEEGNS